MAATWARGLRRDPKGAVGRELVSWAALDAAIVMVESLEEAERALDAYRPGCATPAALWILTRKRGHESYVNQMLLVPGAKKRGLIDNKTCSIDDERSGIRFVVHAPRRAAGSTQAG